MARSVELESQSYWADSASVSRYPALDRNLTVDVVVIGAGITGLTAAYLLKRSGQKVAVIDRRRCGGVDSGMTTAHLTCVTDLGLQALVKHFGRDHAQAAWDAGLAAIAQIDRIVTRSASRPSSTSTRRTCSAANSPQARFRRRCIGIPRIPITISGSILIAATTTPSLAGRTTRPGRRPTRPRATRPWRWRHVASCRNSRSRTAGPARSSRPTMDFRSSARPRRSSSPPPAMGATG